MMLGAEICIRADKLAASVGRSREALRVGLFHLGFNIVSVSVGTLGIGLLTAFARRRSDDPAQQIASAPSPQRLRCLCIPLRHRLDRLCP